MEQWRSELQHVFEFTLPVKVMSMDDRQSSSPAGLLILDEVHLIKKQKIEDKQAFPVLAMLGSPWLDRHADSERPDRVPFHSRLAMPY